MKTGILSDNHLKSGYTKEVIDLLKGKNCKYLIRAGDFCCEKNLQLLKESNLKYTVVFGNNDRDLFDLTSKYNIKSEPYYFKIEDLKFELMHLPYHLTSDSNIAVFRHTHKFHCEYTNKTLFLNPGRVCTREEPIISCTQLEINENEYIITRYFRNISENNFMKEEFKYGR